MKKTWVLLGIMVLFFSCMKKMELLTLIEVRNRTLSFSNITEISVTVSWDTSNVIDHRNAGPLEYKVVYSLTNNISKMEEIEANGIVAMNWTANVNSYTITGLSIETIYYVNVLVRNQMGNKNRFDAAQIRTQGDNPPIIQSGALTASNITMNSFTVNWNAATDNVTPSAELQYLVYYSTSDNITTIGDAEANGIPVGSYQANITSKTITGLNPGTTYYFTVIVKDGAGNKAIYTKNSVTTISDTTPPTISNTTLTVNNVTTNSFTVNWNAATDNVTPSAELQYLVYYSTSDNITTIGNAEANGIPVGSYQANITSKTITGLNPGTTYYFTVIVKDGAGNKAIYTKNSVLTKKPGDLDTTFTGSGADNSIYAIAIQNDGKILIGGYFTTYNGTTRNYIARINPNGSLDTSFDPGTGANGSVLSIVLQSDGKILIGGSFTTYNGTTRNGIARINPNGSLDTSFDPGTGASSFVSAVALQSDGKILIGGAFTTYNGITRNRIARINSNGSLDNTFDSSVGADFNVLSIVLQSNGKILIGGGFDKYNNITRNRIARINSDGSLDTSFDPGTGMTENVLAIAIQNDGKILIGGAFTTYNGTTRKHIARIWN